MLYKMQRGAQVGSFSVFINLCVKKAEQVSAKSSSGVFFVLLFVLNFETHS